MQEMAEIPQELQYSESCFSKQRHLEEVHELVSIFLQLATGVAQNWLNEVVNGLETRGY